MFMNVFATWPPFAFGFPALSPGARHGGEFIPGIFDDGDAAIHYKLFVPSAYRGEPLPLVVMLHGCGQDASDFALGTGMNALILYPEQSASAHWNRCWNWYDSTHHHRGEGEPALIAALTRHVAAGYAVDHDHIFVAGLSSGAAMAVILGRTYPDLFTAVGSHSGLAHGSATDALGAMLAMRDGASPDILARAAPAAGVPAAGVPAAGGASAAWAECANSAPTNIVSISLFIVALLISCLQWEPEPGPGPSRPACGRSRCGSPSSGRWRPRAGYRPRSRPRSSRAPC
jgi:poly(3-hydroxybutyrate) depolymerase